MSDGLGREAAERAEEAVEAAARGGTYAHRTIGFGGAAAFGSLWRLIRGEDNRGRKVRWLFSLLRPYRRQVLMMLGALILATGATLAPPFLVGQATAAARIGDTTGRSS